MKICMIYNIGIVITFTMWVINNTIQRRMLMKKLFLTSLILLALALCVTSCLKNKNNDVDTPDTDITTTASDVNTEDESSQNTTTDSSIGTTTEDFSNEEPSSAESTTKEPSSEESTTEKPTTEESTTEEPTTEETTAEERQTSFRKMMEIALETVE